MTAACVATGLVVAQQKRPLTIEDYYRLKTVGAVQFSPDGKMVSFTVTTRVEDDPAAKRENQSLTERYEVPVDGSAPPRLVERQAPNPGGGGRGARPLPSPDGAWVMEPREQERRRAQPVFKSDFEKRHHERFKGVTFDWKDFQRDGASFPAPDPTAAGAIHLTGRPAAGGEPRVLLDRDLRPSAMVWHPDGKLLAFTADTDWRDELKYASPDLWTVTIDGKVTQLTNDGYSYGDLGFSPDGKYLSYARTFGTDMVIQQKLNHGGPRDLFIRALSNGETVNLTAKWDLEPGDSRWSPDGRYLYFTAATGGEVHLFRVAAAPRTQGPADPGTHKVEQVTTGPRRLNGLVFDSAMTKIAYTVGLHETPADVYVANIDGSGERRLTDINKELVSEVALSRSERLQWRSADGTSIEGWLTFPYGYSPTSRYPLIVTSHGGPHSATGYSFDFKDQYFAANGYFVLDTNFRSSTGYGEAFKWATWGAWGNKDGQDIIAGIDHVLRSYPIDRARVGHIGHSYGGFLSNWLITQYPDRFAAAVSGAGISNWISDYGTADIYRTKETEFYGTPWDKEARERMIRQSPLTYAGRVKTPTLFVHGERDQRVPYEEAEQMYFALKRRGVAAKMIQYAGQPHGISGHNNVVHRMLSELAWFDKYLKAAPQKTTTTPNAKRQTPKER